MEGIDSKHTKPVVGIATENGRSYYRILSLLTKIGIPSVDVIFDGSGRRIGQKEENDSFRDLRLVITSRKERLRFAETNVACVEDLGEDASVAKARILSMVYPPKETDQYVVGIDPGERTGVVAFLNHVEVETAVTGSVDSTVNRVIKLLDSIPSGRKIVRIGSGMPPLASQIANSLFRHYGRKLRIQLVDERGTSERQHYRISGTKDQISAQIIAFREGIDYTGD